MRIDWWTLAIQAVNVLILVWLLARFFYRPLVKIIDERRQASEKLLAEAKAAVAAAEAEQAEIAKVRAGFGAERDAMITAAKVEADKARAAMTRQAQDEAAALRAGAQTDISRARTAMEKELAEKASDLAVAIAARLLAAPPPAESADGFLACIGALGDRDRNLLAAAAKRGSLTVVTAHPLDPVARTAIGAALDRQFGAPAPAFAVDAALISGWRFEADTLLFHRDWGEELKRIRKELTTAGAGNDDGQQLS